MTLSALIRKRDSGELATAISAIPATQPKGEAATVARVATVAVANPEEEKTATIPETLLDRQREARRQKVIAMLEAAPSTQRAIYTDTKSDPHNVILAVAVRACQQTCELLIPKAKYDPWRLLELVERHGQTRIGQTTRGVTGNE